MILFIRNKAKICLVSLVLLALTSVVSGCGGADSSVEGTSAGSESTQTVADATASSTPKSTKNQTTKSATPTATKSSADSAAKTTPTAVQKTVPKLTDVSFT
jgi:cell division septation protein DedD